MTKPEFNYQQEKRIIELEEWIDNAGQTFDICTFHILKKICSYCECKRKEKLNDQR